MAYLLEKLKSGNAQERRDAVRMLINRTVFDWVADRDEREIDFAIPDLAMALSDSDEEVRKLAIEAIHTQQQSFEGRSIFPAIPAIIEVLLDHNREHLRADASVVFRDAIIEGYDVSKDISPLSDLLTDKNESVKFGMADALTFYHASKGKWEEVAKLLHHGDKDVRQEAAGTLGHFQITTKANVAPSIPQLIQLLSDENKEVRFVAARSLAKIANKTDQLQPALDLLVQFLTDPETKIRNNAIKSLGTSIEYKIHCNSNLAKGEWIIYAPVVRALEDLYPSGEEQIKKSIARVLMGFYLHTRNYPQIERLLQSREPSIREELSYELSGCTSFCEVDFAPIIPTLLQMFLSDEDDKVRNAMRTRLEYLAERKLTYAELILKECQNLNIDPHTAGTFFEQLHKIINRKKRARSGDKS